MHDIRETALRFHGYVIRCGKGSDGRYHSSVSISETAYSGLAVHFSRLALLQQEDRLIAELRAIPYVPNARIQRQISKLVREVNARRKAAGIPPISWSRTDLTRVPVRVFDSPHKCPAAGSDDTLEVLGRDDSIRAG